MDLSALTLTQLRYIVALDNTRSFRAAAEASHVSQPALSTQVQKLEKLLGVVLFDRAQQPIVPTAQGQHVLEQARIAVREADRIADVAQRDDEPLSGTYHLGVIPTIASTLLPLLLPRWVKAHPGVTLKVREVQTQDMIEQLHHDELDGGIAATPLGVPRMHEVPLYREAFSVYLPAGHPLSSQDAIAQSRLADEAVWIMADGHCFRDQVLHLCRADRHAGPGDVEFESGSFETLVRLVDNGLGVTVLPELIIAELDASRRKRARPFSAPIPTREVSLVYSRPHLHRRIADALVAVARDAVPASLHPVGATAEHFVLPPN